MSQRNEPGEMHIAPCAFKQGRPMTVTAHFSAKLDRHEFMRQTLYHLLQPNLEIMLTSTAYDLAISARVSPAARRLIASCRW